MACNDFIVYNEKVLGFCHVSSDLKPASNALVVGGTVFIGALIVLSSPKPRS